MPAPPASLPDALPLSPDQAAARAAVARELARAGVDLDAGAASPADPDRPRAVLAVTGKAGSGKSMLLAALTDEARALGVDLVVPEWEGRRRRDRRTLAVLAPTNKAASVLRAKGVAATTIHRILYTPVYDPQYEKVAEWLAGERERPGAGTLTEDQLDRARAAFDQHRSVPAALAAAGLRGSDFITGWTRRKEPLDLGFVDESSMLDARALEDLREIFPTLVLFGDPAQLPPVKSEGGATGMVFESLPAAHVHALTRVHRQAADSPILDLAHALADPLLDFEAFEDMVRDAAARDERVAWAPRADSDVMARSPVLCWRNATRVKLIGAFRAAHGIAEGELVPGEPLVCDGIELPMKHRKKRLDLEARGLIKGAGVIYLGPGRKPGFSRLHVLGALEPQVSAASIVRIEQDGEPFVPFAAAMGATFLHGAAVTIHKAQGSQWDVVQVFAPDILVAARTGRMEAGHPLWKRLAYVAVTRAQRELRWVVQSRLSRPREALGVEDLRGAAPLGLEAWDADAP